MWGNHLFTLLLEENAVAASNTVFIKRLGFYSSKMHLLLLFFFFFKMKSGLREW